MVREPTRGHIHVVRRAGQGYGSARWNRSVLAAIRSRGTRTASAAGGAGCAAGAGAAAGGGGGTSAPSQPLAAVAGVQLALRQHSSLVPFLHTTSPEPFCQLSMRLPPSAAVTRVCAPAAVDRAATANNSATLFSFFMVLLLGKKPQPRCVYTTFKVTITKSVKSLCHTSLHNQRLSSSSHVGQNLIPGVLLLRCDRRLERKI